MPDIFDEFENLGSDVADAVNRATRSGDFSHLGSDITSLVGQALDGVGRQMRASERGAYNRSQTTSQRYAGQAGQPGRGPMGGAGGQGGNVINGTAREVGGNPVYVNPPGRNMTQQNYGPVRVVTNTPQRPSLYENVFVKKVLSIIGMTGLYAAFVPLSIVAIILFALGAEPETAFAAGLGVIFSGMSIASILGGVACTKVLARLGRFERYVKALGGKTYGKLQELAAAVGKTERGALKDIEDMIRRGYFLQGHIDAQQTTLITSNETYKQYMETENAAQIAKSEKEAAELELQRQRALEDESLAGLTPEQRDMIIQGNAYIQQIRDCNARIPGAEISAKLYKLENSTKMIMERAKTDPKFVRDLHRLMSYYLPTAVKLLNSYAELDAQPVSTQNIEKSKKDIENAIDALNDAFDRIFDDMFTETNLDISTDAEVLTKVLQNEGLIGNEDEMTLQPQLK